MYKREDMLPFIVEIVKEASNLISSNFSITQKGDGTDLVTNLDVEVENFLINKIRMSYPGFDIVSEENNANKSITENCFVIDPIDGTINFANNIPFWGIQVACIIDYEVVAAVIYLPKINELYTADETGSYLNDVKINSSVVNINNALYAVDGSDSIPTILKVNAKGTGMRKFGALCVSTAFVACGRIHGALFTSNKPWDYLPGLFIAKQAGAAVLDEPGFHGTAMNEEFLNILKNAVEDRL